jgi:hypothetical protein
LDRDGGGRRTTADNGSGVWRVGGREEMGRSGVDVVYDMMWWWDKRRWVVVINNPFFFTRSFTRVFTCGFTRFLPAAQKAVVGVPIGINVDIKAMQL